MASMPKNAYNPTERREKAMVRLIDAALHLLYNVFILH